MTELKELRIKTGLSQTEFAKELNITNDYLSALENGKKSPSFKLAQKIANKLEKTVDDIFLSTSRTKHSD